MSFWKIKNTSNIDVKLAVKIASNRSNGVILKPGEFCISLPQLTAAIDAQSRRRLISIEKDFKNDYSLEIGKNYSESELDKLIKEAEKYIKNE